MPVARLSDPLFARTLAALIRRRRETRYTSHFATILERAPAEKFHHQQPRPIDPDPFELHQLTNLVEARVAPGLNLGTTFCFELRNLLAQKGVMSIHAQDPITQTRRNGRTIPNPKGLKLQGELSARRH